jgi:hypothetical protein
MKVGDLIRVMKDNCASGWPRPSKAYKGYQDRLGLVVRGVAGHNGTRVQMVDGGAELWFPTKELEVVK